MRRNSIRPHLGFEAIHVLHERPGGIFVAVRRRETEELGRIRERRVGPVDAIDGAFETGPLAPETLRPLRISPHRGVLQRAPDLGEAFALPRDVKDTP